MSENKTKKETKVKAKTTKTAVKKASTAKKSTTTAKKDTSSSKTETKSKTDFTGKYISAVGRRKTSVARVRLYQPGKGLLVVNGKAASDYMLSDNIDLALQPLKVCSKINFFDISVIVKGGGVFGQVDAIKHGVARGLLKFDPELKAILKLNGYLTRDSRKKERKKPGLKKARKAPQWSKR